MNAADDIEEAELLQLLESMEARGLVQSEIDPQTGELVWAATLAGHEALAREMAAGRA